MPSTNRPHIHSAACWFTWRKRTEKRSLPHQHSQSTVPAIEWLFSLLSLFFLIFAPALSCVWFTPVLLSIATPLCYQASSQSPLDSVSKQTGRERVRGRGWGEGRTDKATSVSDTIMALSQHQYHVCAPSFSASHRVIDPPPRLAPFPFPIQVCPSPALILSKLLFWLKRWWFGLMGLCLFPDSTLCGSVGRGLVGALEWF